MKHTYNISDSTLEKIIKDTECKHKESPMYKVITLIASIFILLALAYTLSQEITTFANNVQEVTDVCTHDKKSEGCTFTLPTMILGDK